MRKIIEKSGAAIIIESILHEIFGNFTRGTKQNSECLQNWENTPLHIAADKGQLGAYQLIMEYIAHSISHEMHVLNKKRLIIFGFDANQSTPFHLAAKNGYLSVCKLTTFLFCDMYISNFIEKSQSGYNIK